MTGPTQRDDDASLPREVAAYWRFRGRTTRALVVVALALVALVVFQEPRKWPNGEAIQLAAQITLWIAVVVAYANNARMAERRGFVQGRFSRSPTEFSPAEGHPELPRQGGNS